MLDIVRYDNTIAIIGNDKLSNIDELIDALWWNDIYIGEDVYIDTNQSRLYYFTMGYARPQDDLENLRLILNIHGIVYLKEIDYNSFTGFYNNGSMIDSIIKERMD